MANDYETVRNTVACFEANVPCGLKITGDGAEEWLNELFTKDVETLPPLKGLIGLFLQDDGSLIAIANLFRDEEDDFFVFSDRAELAAYLDSNAGEDVSIEPVSNTHRIIAVLGPKAQDMISDTAGEDILSIPYMGFEEAAEADFTVFRQGFTGEYEFRLLVPNESSDQVRADIVAAVEDLEGKEISADVMDLLCLEMRSINNEDVVGKATALEAGLHWMIDFQKESFKGLDAVSAEKSALKRKSLIVTTSDKGVAAAGADLTIEGQAVGTVVRSMYSPTLECDIAFCYLDASTGWVGVNYDIKTDAGTTLATALSSPLFVTRTVLDA